jgi:glycosyltransferase involved in cell wall biosynthesis
MASGLPVVGTDVAGIPEQVVDGASGWLVPPGDPALLAERLSELLGDVRLRERMGARGSERAERFSVERMLKDLDALYDGLIHGEGTTYSPGGNPR